MTSQNNKAIPSAEIVSNYSRNEELANAISHAIGIIFGFYALYTMVTLSINITDSLTNTRLASSIIYGVSIILLFATSTIYHSVKKSSTRAFMKTLDHCAIYLLIAGSYTPFMLISLADSGGPAYLSAIWTIAILGIFFKIFFGHRYPKISLASYLALGWFVVIAGKEMLAGLSDDGLILLAAGGLSYTFGAVFYAWKRLTFNHAIWHLFVLAGAAFHYFSIYWYVLPSD